MEQMFQRLKKEIMTKFEVRFIEQNRKIDELAERVLFQYNIYHLLIKCGDNEQYSRCNCLGIHGIEFKKIKYG